MVDPRDPEGVCRVLREAAEMSLRAPCRSGCCDVIQGPGRLIATGDLHDNPVNLQRVLDLAGLGEEFQAAAERTHVTLHELIHTARLINGLDLSYRVLVKAAELKLSAPHRVHLLLANHELSQIAGAGIVKDGVNVVKAFNDGVEYVFGSDTEAVLDAIGVFIRSMALALRCRAPGGDLLCCHSLPDPDLLDRFDPSILERPLEEGDYTPRRGSAHIMVWGRDHTPEELGDLARRWGVAAFILGHEKAEEGWFIREPNCLVLNSDHAKGAIADAPLGGPVTVSGLRGCVVALG
jgi:hypothetical protein